MGPSQNFHMLYQRTKPHSTSFPQIHMLIGALPTVIYINFKI